IRGSGPAPAQRPPAAQRLWAQCLALSPCRRERWERAASRWRADCRAIRAALLLAPRVGSGLRWWPTGRPQAIVRLSVLLPFLDLESLGGRRAATQAAEKLMFCIRARL